MIEIKRSLAIVHKVRYMIVTYDLIYL